MKKLAGLIVFFLISVSMFGQFSEYVHIPTYEYVNNYIKLWEKDTTIHNPSSLDCKYMRGLLDRATYWFSAHNNIYILSFEHNEKTEHMYWKNSDRNLYLYRLVGGTTWEIACDKPILKAFWRSEGLTEGNHGYSVFSYLSYYGQTDIDVFVYGIKGNENYKHKGYVKMDESGNVTINLTLLSFNHDSRATMNADISSKLIYLTPKGDGTYMVKE